MGFVIDGLFGYALSGFFLLGCIFFVIGIVASWSVLSFYRKARKADGQRRTKE